MKKIVIGYRHTGLITKDINKSVHFYRDLLGFEVIQDFWDQSDYICKIIGLEKLKLHMVKLKSPDGSVIELLDYESHPTQPVQIPFNNVGVAHLALRVEDIEYAYTFLKKNGVTFVSEPTLSSEGFAKVCLCYDPDGMRIELVEMLNV